MGNYTIKGLAKANECDELNANGLADVWAYWLECNCNDTQSIENFRKLRKKDRQSMLDYLRFCTFHRELYNHLVSHLYD